MKTSAVVTWLSAALLVLSLLAVGFGLLSQAGDGAFTFITAHNTGVPIYGRGIYGFDTPVAALSFKAGDIVTLCLALPLLVVSTIMYRRGSLRGGLLLAGAYSYFLYNYGSMAFGAAYNPLFLVYVVLFSCGLYGLVTTLGSFDPTTVAARFSAQTPRRGIGIFLIVSGAVLLVVWLALSAVPALLQGTTPGEADYYTTFVTGVVDIAVVAPALIVTGVLVNRRAPMGDLLAATLLVFTVILGPSLAIAGILQRLAGVIDIGQALTFTVPFVVLTLIAGWFAYAMHRRLES